MARVLVTEKLAERGLALAGQAGHDVDVRLEPDRPTPCSGCFPAPTR